MDVPAPTEHVVLLDAAGAAIGTLAKADAHHADTPLHLAFSCYVFDEQDRLLVSQRALSKSVFPGLWTNSVCGHPASGESLDAAVRRRAAFELGLDLGPVRVVLPDFAYRAEMDGIVENEMCPVLVAGPLPGSAPAPNPAEVEDVQWVPWPDFAASVLDGWRSVSPWCALQVAALSALGTRWQDWPDGSSAALPAAVRA